MQGVEANHERFYLNQIIIGNLFRQSEIIF